MSAYSRQRACYSWLEAGWAVIGLAVALAAGIFLGLLSARGDRGLL